MQQHHRITFLLIFYVEALLVASTSLSSSSSPQMFDSNTINYLKYFGYLTADVETSLTSTNSVSQALKTFQGYWSLPVDGTLNDDTKTLMQTSRCGVHDEILEYTVHSFKWEKRELYWYFHSATSTQITTAEKAFSEWSKITGIKFHNTRLMRQADIIISFGKSQHTFISNWGVCNYKLINETIAHAYMPNGRESTVREIHIAKDFDWEMGLGVIHENLLSLYWVLIHEIGHSLGIGHSSIPSAVMYPYYRHYNSTDAFSFNYDDINAAKYLYKNNEDTVDVVNGNDKFASDTTENGAANIPNESPLTADGICKVNLKHLKFFIFRKRMYVFYKQWVWALNLNVKNRRYENPQFIRQWLTFLPKNFTEISAIYQRPSNDIALFSDNKIYVFDPNTLKLLPDWPKTYQDVFSPSFSYNDVQAAVLTNTGKTYIVYKGLYVIELNECTYRPRKYLSLMELFKGVGGSNKFNFSFFKYTNGKIYLLEGNRYYEYDDFNEAIVKSDTFDLSLFGIECPIESTITKLRRLMNKLLFFYDKSDDGVAENGEVGQLEHEYNRVNSFETVSGLKSYMERMI